MGIARPALMYGALVWVLTQIACDTEGAKLLFCLNLMSMGHFRWSTQTAGLRLITKAVRKVQLFETYLHFLHLFGFFRIVIKAKISVLVHTVAAWKKRLPLVKNVKAAGTLEPFADKPKKVLNKNPGLEKVPKLPTGPIMAFFSLCWVRVPSTD